MLSPLPAYLSLFSVRVSPSFFHCVSVYGCSSVCLCVCRLLCLSPCMTAMQAWHNRWVWWDGKGVRVVWFVIRCKRGARGAGLLSNLEIESRAFHHTSLQYERVNCLPHLLVDVHPMSATACALSCSVHPSLQKNFKYNKNKYKNKYISNIKTGWRQVGAGAAAAAQLVDP